MTKGYRVGFLFLVPVLIGLADQGWAQQTHYKQTNLVANLAGVANHTDAQLSNPWGIAFIGGQPFWTANNNGGTSTLYDSQGNKMQPTVNIPGAAVNTACNPGCPTGIVANPTLTNFSGALFIFDTEDGILASWNGAGDATRKVDRSGTAAVYKGLALVNNATGSFLLVANFFSGQIDVFDHNFQRATLQGSFTDPNFPAAMAPHGVHVINNQVYVAYAMQDAAKHDPMLGAGNGVVDVFDVNGNFVKRFASGGALNAPWGVVQAPANFGTFSNDILVGNFGDGKINAYDANGNSLGAVSDTNGQAIVNEGLWDLVFGANGTGDPNTLYFTAGGSDQTHGLFATLVPEQAAGTDFSLMLSATTVSVSAGQSTRVTINSSGSGGFNSPIALACTGLPAGVTCSFAPTSITPGSATSNSTLTVAVASGYMPMGMVMTGLPFMGLGVMGLVWGARRKASRSQRSRAAWIAAGAALLLGLLLAGVGCSSNSSNSGSPGGNTVMITGTGGGVTHSAPLTLNIH